MQRRSLAFTLVIGFLGLIGLTPERAAGAPGRACGGAVYGGQAYYAPRRTTYYAPSAPYAAPMNGRLYPSSSAAYTEPYPPSPPNAAPLAPAYGQSRSAPPTRMQSPRQPTTEISVAMHDNRFQPQSINVQPGTTVRWTNNGTHAHTVTAKNDSWDSGDIKPGATYSATFQQPGTYHYYCRHHDGMDGTIVVGQGAANGSASPRSGGY